MAEATQNAGRVDQSVREMNALKTDIVSTISEHEGAITASGHAAEAAHARLTALQFELDAYSGRTETTVREITGRGHTCPDHGGVQDLPGQHGALVLRHQVARREEHERRQVQGRRQHRRQGQRPCR